MRKARRIGLRPQHSAKLGGVVATADQTLARNTRCVCRYAFQIPSAFIQNQAEPRPQLHSASVSEFSAACSCSGRLLSKATRPRKIKTRRMWAQHIDSSVTLSSATGSRELAHLASTDTAKLDRCSRVVSVGTGRRRNTAHRCSLVSTAASTRPSQSR